MPTYIQLVNFTREGLADVEQGPERVEQARRLIESLGGEMKDFYLTMGRYDAVVIAELPDDETVATGTLKYLEEGTVETETMRAFTDEEYRDIVANLPE